MRALLRLQFHRWSVGGGAARRCEPWEGELGQMLCSSARGRAGWRFELDRERNTATYEQDEQTENSPD